MSFFIFMKGKLGEDVSCNRDGIFKSFRRVLDEGVNVL